MSITNTMERQEEFLFFQTLITRTTAEHIFQLLITFIEEISSKEKVYYTLHQWRQGHEQSSQRSQGRWNHWGYGAIAPLKIIW